MQHQHECEYLLPLHCEPESSERARVSRSLARAQACWPGDIHVAWDTVANLQVRLAGVHPVDQQQTSTAGLCESFCLWRGGRHGRLDVDARFAAAVASGLMGSAPMLPMARALTPAERGMFAAVIASVLEHLGAPLQLALEVPDAVPVRLEIQADLDLRFQLQHEPAIVGWARISTPAAWLEVGAIHWPNLARVPFPATVEWARTQIDGKDLARLEIGDGIVFGGFEMPDWDGQMAIWLSFGEFRIPARFHGETLYFDGAAEPALEPVGRVFSQPHSTRSDAARTAPIAGKATPWKGSNSMTSTTDITSGGATAGSSEAPAASLTQALANTPIEVVAELGRFVLTGAEIAGLGNGHVLSLGSESRGLVTLSVAGRPVGKGVLVNIDGSFGVRVTERF